jgi:hypothetical protein
MVVPPPAGKPGTPLSMGEPNWLNGFSAVAQKESTQKIVPIKNQGAARRIRLSMAHLAFM